jgi:hypothetical protein
MSELTFIGLDMHARSVAAAVLNAGTGEVRSAWTDITLVERGR